MSGVRKLRLISRSPCVCCTTSTTCRHGYCLGRSLHQRLGAVKPRSQEKRVLALSRDHIPKLLKELFVTSSAKVASRANLFLAASKVELNPKVRPLLLLLHGAGQAYASSPQKSFLLVVHGITKLSIDLIVSSLRFAYTLSRGSLSNNTKML